MASKQQKSAEKMKADAIAKQQAKAALAEKRAENAEKLEEMLTDEEKEALTDVDAGETVGSEESDVVSGRGEEVAPLEVRVEILEEQVSALIGTIKELRDKNKVLASRTGTTERKGHVGSVDDLGKIDDL